jgi:predicted MPP superfamily phosphohydrolase
MDVILTGARFLSPSLGKPSFLSMHDKSLATIIVARKGYLDPYTLKNSFFLKSVSHQGSSVALQPTQITEIRDIPFNSYLRKILQPSQEKSFFEVKLEMTGNEMSPYHPHKRYVLYDLSHPQIDTSFHSVVFLFHEWESYRFFFISDTHVAKAWDSIQADFSRFSDSQKEIDRENVFTLSRAFSKRAYLENFINPNKNLVQFIKIANAKAEKNELDFIIAGGDLVDYTFKRQSKHRATPYTDTNYQLFEDILTGKYDSDVELKVPLFSLTGNHDYRLYPYSIGKYGLSHCGVHDFLKDYYLAKFGKKARRMLSIKDLDAIRVKKGKNHSLNYYHIHFNPHKDFSFSISKTRFIFLDSGKDAFHNVVHTHVLRYKNLARAILASWHFPDSEGLSDRQIHFIQREVITESPKNVILVFHAGLMNTSFTYTPVKENFQNKMSTSCEIGSANEYTFPILANNYLQRHDRLKTNVTFENRLKKLGLNFGCLFKNQLKLLALACNHGVNFLGLSGHNHRNMEIKVDKNKGSLHTKNYTQNSLTDPFDEKTAYFFCTNALAHIQSRYKTPQFPGFYEVHIQNDRIAEIRRKKLNAYPLDTFQFFVRQNEKSKSLSTIEVFSEVSAAEKFSQRENLRLMVTFLIGVKKDVCFGSKLPFDITPQCRGNVIAKSSKPLAVEETSPYIRKKNVCFSHSFLCEWHPVLPFDFRRTDNSRITYEVSVIGEYILETPDGYQSLKLCWHPTSLILKP